ncbi:hypothetical protein B0O80DRAFT_196137 [Mortierella sp. GBAus27b]|nr:hypothetical protein B0O80DRAFT_196137 [Mortierella sp. GBAus27b]
MPCVLMIASDLRRLHTGLARALLVDQHLFYPLSSSYLVIMNALEHNGPTLFAGHNTIQEYSEALSLTAAQQQQLADALRLQMQQEQTYTPESPNRPSRRPYPSSSSSPLSSSSSSVFAAWARAQATGSAYFLLVGGALCLFFPGWFSGAYSILLGILVQCIERKPFSPSGSGSPASNSTTTPPPRLPPLSARSFMPATVLRAHSVRALFYIVAAIPCFLRAPNYSGGICLVSSATTYAVAGAMDWRKKRVSRPRRRSHSRSN